MDPTVPLKASASTALGSPDLRLPAGQALVEQAQSHFSDAANSAPPWVRSELQSLRHERDEELLASGLLHIAGRLKGQNKLEDSAFLLSLIAESSLPQETRNKAAAQLQSLQGGGAFGQRAEFLLSQFAQNATDAKLIAPMLGASFLGQAAGSMALGRLLVPASRGSGGLFQSAWLARLGAGSAGFLAEASAFTVLGRAISPHAPGPWGDDFLRSTLTIGALRFAGMGGNALSRQLARSPYSGVSQISHVVLPQAAALTGLMAAHRLEEKVGLRPHVEGSSLFFESLAALISLNVGSRLGHHALGGRFHEIQGELAFRARQLSQTPRFPNPFQPRQPAFAMAGNLPGRALSEDMNPGKVLMMANSMGDGKKNDGPFGSGQAGSPKSSQSGIVNPHAVQVRPETLDPAELIDDTSIPPENFTQYKPPVDPPVNPPTVEVADPYIGQVIDGRYRIDDVLGEGGFGIVYRGTQKMLNKPIAIKVLKKELGSNPEMIHRFLNEARAASTIGNPHITEVSDFGKLPDGSNYFVMEFLKGELLYHLVEDGKSVPAPRLVHIARQLAEGLGAAHQAGIVHRDLKPENVFLIKHGKIDDFVKILDFGIARVQSTDNTRLTREGAVFGTPDYMSPEQGAGTPVDHRGDIYSYGVMLYEMATGQLPFQADNMAKLLTLHMYKSPTPPREVVSNPEQIPMGLEAIILKCLEKKPENRYQSMEEVVADLNKLQQGLTPEAATDLALRGDNMELPDYFGVDSAPKRTPRKSPGPEETMFLQRGKPRWPLLAGIGGIGAVGAITAAALFAASRAEEDSKPVVPNQGATPPQVVPDTPEVTDVQPDAPPAPEKVSVMLSIEPNDAEVFQGDKSLGVSPVLIQIEKGRSLEVEARREGYKPKKIQLDDSQEKRSLTLEKDGKASSHRPRPNGKGPGPKGPKPKGSSEEIFNPWK